MPEMCNWLTIASCLQVSEDESLALAAAVEHASEHPLASAVLEYAEASLAGPLPAELSQDSVAALSEPSSLLQGSTEPSSPTVGLTPTAGRRHPRRTDWVRDVRDPQPTPGVLRMLLLRASRSVPFHGMKSSCTSNALLQDIPINSLVAFG